MFRYIPWDTTYPDQPLLGNAPEGVGLSSEMLRNGDVVYTDEAGQVINTQQNLLLTIF